MDELSELRLHVLALATAVGQNRKFFASINHYVDRFKEIVTKPAPDVSQSEVQLLARKIEEFYRQWRPTGDLLYIPPRETADTDPTVREINQLVDRLANLSEGEFKALLPKSATPEPYSASTEPGMCDAPCVFIGHGRSKLWARLKVFLQDELGVATVAYESEPRTGESIVPVLEKMLKQATFAVLVLTAEDDTADGSRRARQNVVHEAGLFQGRLGFKRAILLVQGGIEEFSNVAGLQYLPFTDNKIEQSFYELQRVLKREKQIS
jgi:predicted nucleotide-binding protein